MEEGTLASAVISAYRSVIHERYDYHRIKETYEIPESFTEDKFDALREYFLAYIYPPPSERAHLNAAFESLEGHIANPKYLLNVLMDSIGVLFKYGRHLPKILKTGLAAMQSFQKASAFENQLGQAASKSKRTAPYSAEDIAFFTAQLPEAEVNHFIDDSLVLFKTLHDRKLVSRIIDIVTTIIDKMKSKPAIYPSEEIHGLELGKELIVKGDALFESLTEVEQELLFDLVVEVERDALSAIFEKE